MQPCHFLARNVALRLADARRRARQFTRTENVISKKRKEEWMTDVAHWMIQSHKG